MAAPDIVNKLRDLVHTITGKISWLPPLLVRIVLGGYIFLLGGYRKLTGDFFVDTVAGWGFSNPKVVAPLIASAEIFGGTLLLLGLGTRILASPMLIGLMLGALKTAILPKADGWDDVHGFGATLYNFFGGNRWIEDLFSADEFLYVLVFLWMGVAGPGSVSLDHLIAKKLFKEEAQGKRAMG